MRKLLLLLARLRGRWTNRPVLYGDGQHDDAQALQAFIDGATVIAPRGYLLKKDGPVMRLPAGEYLVRSPLRVEGTLEF